MGVHGGHVSAQTRIQTTDSPRLDGTIYGQGDETHAPGHHAVVIGPRHSEQQMLVLKIHQTGSMMQNFKRVWLAMQAMRARYPEEQGIIGLEFFNANAHGQLIGYSPGNADHLQKIDTQSQACASSIRGILVSPQTPSRIDNKRTRWLD
jgi:hypothetical protein